MTTPAGSGFSDPIVGGIGTLIRQYIQSPNYSAGVSGWSINQDGSAEFNNLVVRGTINLQPATVGQTPHSIWWSDTFAVHGQIVMDANNGLFMNAGNDGTANTKYGSVVVGTNRGANSVYAQLAAVTTDPTSMALFLTAATVQVKDNNGAGHGQVFLGNQASTEHISVQGAEFDVNVPTIFATSASSVHMNTGVTLEMLSGATLKVDSGATFQVGTLLEILAAGSLKLDTGATFQQGNGPSGKYYDEAWSLAANNILSGTTQTLGAGVVFWTLSRSNNDYATAMNTGTGVWTCPEDGFYIFTLRTGGWGTTVATAARQTLLINTPTTLVLDTGSFSGQQAFTAGEWIPKNTTVTFQALQVSGATRSMSWFLAIHRVG